ncbi:hypothetical protein D3C87_1655520 [compost metagenome]
MNECVAGLDASCLGVNERLQPSVQPGGRDQIQREKGIGVPGNLRPSCVLAGQSSCSRERSGGLMELGDRIENLPNVGFCPGRRPSRVAQVFNDQHGPVRVGIHAIQQRHEWR